MWSPQRYIATGQVRGVDKDTLEAVVETYKRLQSRRAQGPVLLSLRHLSLRAKVDYFVLRKVISNDFDRPYRSFLIRKRSGSMRRIHVPSPQLMAVQKWISVHVLRDVPTHPASQAFSRYSSIYKCAEHHCEARWLIKLDISNFFENVLEIQCYRVFLSLGYQPLVAFELARLCTLRPWGSWAHELNRHKHEVPRRRQVRQKQRKIIPYDFEFLGRLPQGAPTSPMLANLAMRDTDAKLATIATAFGLRYTRYSDDLTFSTTLSFDREKATELINQVAVTLKQVGLNLNSRKTRVVPPGPRKLVLGLLVDGLKPRLTRQYKDRIRQHLYYVEKLGIETHARQRGFDSVGGLHRHLRGLIDFANMVEPIYAADALRRLQAALPNGYI